jgi:hypothetical protein
MPRAAGVLRPTHALYRALAGPATPSRPQLLAFLSPRTASRWRIGCPGRRRSIPVAGEKAAELVSRGLEHVAAARGMAVTDVLRRSSLVRLFRVGFTLSRAPRK